MSFFVSCKEILVRHRFLFLFFSLLIFKHEQLNHMFWFILLILEQFQQVQILAHSPQLELGYKERVYK